MKGNIATTGTVSFGTCINVMRCQWLNAIHLQACQTKRLLIRFRQDQTCYKVAGEQDEMSKAGSLERTCMVRQQCVKMYQKFHQGSVKVH